MAPSASGLIFLNVRPFSASTITSSLSPSAYTANAKCWLSGDQVPEDSTYRSASKCGLEAALESLRICFPVRASARKRSTENRSCSDRYAM